MDFRTKITNPPTWSLQDMMRQMPIKVYQHADFLGMFQLEAPDRSTSFLTCFDTCTEDLSLAHYYAIEAPRHCPVRQAFEVGDITWLDFWAHKGWLLRIEVPRAADCSSKYIAFSDLDALTLKFFKKYGSTGPLLLMLKQIKSRIKIAKLKGQDAMVEERDLHNFLTIHGHRLKDKAA